eukprot:2393515-Amphidinium_carterae.2
MAVLELTRGTNQSNMFRKHCFALDLSEVATGTMVFYDMVHAIIMQSGLGDVIPSRMIECDSALQRLRVQI